MGEEALHTPCVLLLGGQDGRPSELTGPIADLGFVPVSCATFEAAEQALEQADEPIRCAVVPTSLADRGLRRSLKPVRRAGARGGLQLAAFGPEPERSARRLLRAAGVRYALWEPVEEATLRFQLNRLTRAGATHEVRRARRAPSRVPARVYAGGRGRDTLVYSLSESGAFLETPRACMSGAEVEVELLLPDTTVTLAGSVAFANVPGNLQRPNLPLGMGVHFHEPSATERNVVVGYVESRLAQLEV
jgi:hypothetical protein